MPPSDPALSLPFALSPFTGDPAISQTFSVSGAVSDPALSEAFIIGEGAGDSAVSEPLIVGIGAGEPAGAAILIAGSDFVGVPLSGGAPLSVQFTFINGGTPATTYLWDFGDTYTSAVQNPLHVYAVPGTYTVTLIADQALPTQQIITKLNYVVVIASAVDFVGVPTSGDAPLTVDFTDLSTNFPTTWLWNFGDGDLSTLKNPTHIYDLPGVYTVTLTATNPITGAKTETKTNYITATTPVPVAAFSAVPVVGYVPLDVTFTDLSTGFPNSWLWDFGDPASGPLNASTDENPIHTYLNVGTYTVTLTVSNITGTDSVTQTDYITVLAIPSVTADFIVNSIIPSGGGLQASFQNQSLGAVSYLWDFGDPGSGVNNTSTLLNPTHTYAGPGIYQVTLTATNGSYSDTICKSVLITTEITRYMEIWGTARFSDGTPVAENKVTTSSREPGVAGLDCEAGATDTFHSYKTILDAGVTRFLVRARGNIISIPDSGFADGDPVYVYIGGRQATVGTNFAPLSIPFYMTLPSNPTSTIQVEIVFPVAYTTISPAPGTYDNHVTISLTSNVVPATIYYTLDGSDPKTSPTRIIYTIPFTIIIEGTTTVRYYTHDSLGSVEPVREAVYTVLPPLVRTTPTPSSYSENLSVVLTGNRLGTVWFRLNYTGAFEPYIAPIPIYAGSSGMQTTVIEAYLVDILAEVGPTQVFSYTIDLVRPVITLFTLSNGDPVTASPIITVQVQASSHTNSVIGLLLSTFSDFRDASVRLYQPEVTFLLPGPDGVKTVYAKVVDQFDVYSTTHTATIQLSTEIPAFTLSPSPPGPIGETSYTFTGTKSANSGIYVTVNGGPESLVIPFSTSTTWEYAVTLETGINTILFQAGTWVGNRSGIEVRTVDSRPIPTGVTYATTMTDPFGNWRIPYVFFDEKTGEEATEGISPPRKQHENVMRRQHDFRIRVSANTGPDPIITFPTEGLVLTSNLVTVTGTAALGSIITLIVERRGKVPA